MAKEKNKKQDRLLKDYSGIIIRIIFFIVGAIGLVFSFLTIGSCEFILVTPREAPVGVPDKRPSEFLNITIATVGLFDYNPNYEGCRSIEEDMGEYFTWQFGMARWCALVAALLGCIALFLSAVDVVLCRFVCSRVLISIMFLLAFMSQCLTMLVYASQVCEANYEVREGSEHHFWLNVFLSRVKTGAN